MLHRYISLRSTNIKLLFTTMSRKASLAFQGLDADQLSEFIPDLQEKSDLTCVVCFLCLFLLFVFAVCCVCFFYFLRLPPPKNTKKYPYIPNHIPPQSPIPLLPTFEMANFNRVCSICLLQLCPIRWE